MSGPSASAHLALAILRTSRSALAQQPVLLPTCARVAQHQHQHQHQQRRHHHHHDLAKRSERTDSGCHRPAAQGAQSALARPSGPSAAAPAGTGRRDFSVSAAAGKVGEPDAAPGSTYEYAISTPPAPPTRTTVELRWERHGPRAATEGDAPTAAQVGSGLRTGAIVVAHGLFGSKQNWRSLGRSMAARTGLPVYALDLRNHGDSPHVDSLHYADMAADIIAFIREHVQPDVGDAGVILVGHSMGGKAAQAAALSPDLPKGMLSGLISVDMSPKRGALSKEFAGYVDAMFEIERSKCTSRKEADEILQRWEQDIGVRQFLLTNLTKNPPSNPHWTFRIPLDIIRRHIPQLGDFPYGEGDRKWNGKALFVKGSKSAYINRKNIPLAADLFPQMRLATLEAGHWVQAEKPKEFVDLVERFVKGEDTGEPSSAPA